MVEKFVSDGIRVELNGERFEVEQVDQYWEDDWLCKPGGAVAKGEFVRLSGRGEIPTFNDGTLRVDWSCRDTIEYEVEWFEYEQTPTTSGILTWEITFRIESMCERAYDWSESDEQDSKPLSQYTRN